MKMQLLCIQVGNVKVIIYFFNDYCLTPFPKVHVHFSLLSEYGKVKKDWE